MQENRPRRINVKEDVEAPTPQEQEGEQEVGKRSCLSKCEDNRDKNLFICVLIILILLCLYFIYWCVVNMTFASPVK